MVSSLFLSFVLSCYFHLIIFTSSLSSAQPLCNEDESSALLQFKRSFFIDNSVSSNPNAYPKVESWKLNGNASDCCSWDGVECDHYTGHVIGLDLSSSFLYGSINSNSSLFNLVHLRRLNLADNHFNYSQIPTQIGSLTRLRSLNLSHSAFSGNLPSHYFKNWNAMKITKLGELSYMNVTVVSGDLTNSDSYSITIAQKGTERKYEVIQSALVAIDLSNNKFSGEIPESLGSLSGLKGLNISNNNLTGAIPPSLARLMELEWLDLSQNMLSGKIPQQLTQLTFLEVLDVSHNHLTGRIPRGKQFDTFESSSYDGNPELCGVPLSRSCENTKASPPPSPQHSSQGDETEFPNGIFWMVIFMGYGSGLIVGLVIGTTLTRRYHEWFVETFGRKNKIQKMQKRMEQGN